MFSRNPFFYLYLNSPQVSQRTGCTIRMTNVWQKYAIFGSGLVLGSPAKVPFPLIFHKWGTWSCNPGSVVDQSCCRVFSLLIRDWKMATGYRVSANWSVPDHRNEGEPWNCIPFIQQGQNIGQVFALYYRICLHHGLTFPVRAHLFSVFLW